MAFSETWTGTNGAAWPAGWTHYDGPASTIQSNAGRQGTGASAYTDVWDYQTGTVDGEVLVQVQVSGTTERYVEVGARSTADSRISGNCYAAHFSQDGTCVIFRFDAGAQVQLVATASGYLTIAANAWYWIRFRWQGSKLSASFWPATGGEPGTWSLTTTDSTYSTAGMVGLFVQTGVTGTALTFNWDNLTYTTFPSPKSVTKQQAINRSYTCLLYTSDAADDLLCVDLGGRRI